MDKTPVYLNLVPNKVVDKKGKKSIRVRTTSSEKNRVTATLCCTAAGKLLPPFVVFKGKTKRSLKNVRVPSGVIATMQAKGWMDEDRVLEWINEVWSPYVSGKPALLSLDTFSAHLTVKVKHAFDRCSTKLLVIPEGCTSVLQPLDLSINKPFKSYIRHMWCDYMVAEADKVQGTSKIKPPQKSDLLEWIKTAQTKIESQGTIVKKSFFVAGITNSEEELVRNDEVYQDIQRIMEDVSGDTHVGYVSDDGDPFEESDGERLSVSSDEEESLSKNEDPFQSEEESPSKNEDPFQSEEESPSNNVDPFQSEEESPSNNVDPFQSEENKNIEDLSLEYDLSSDEDENLDLTSKDSFSVNEK